MLDDAQINSFRENGFLHGGPCLTGAEVDTLRDQLDRVIADKDRSDVAQPALLRNMLALRGLIRINWTDVEFCDRVSALTLRPASRLGGKLSPLTSMSFSGGSGPAPKPDPWAAAASPSSLAPPASPGRLSTAACRTWMPRRAWTAGFAGQGRVASLFASAIPNSKRRSTH